MDVRRSAVKWQFAFVYFYDIFVFSCFMTEQIDHVIYLLTRLRDAGVTLKLKAYNFLTETIHKMGEVICTRQLKIPSHTVSAITRFKARQNVTKLDLFLVLCNVFRRVVPNFAKIASQLSDNIRKTSPSTSNGTRKSLKR